MNKGFDLKRLLSSNYHLLSEDSNGIRVTNRLIDFSWLTLRDLVFLTINYLTHFHSFHSVLTHSNQQTNSQTKDNAPSNVPRAYEGFEPTGFKQILSKPFLISTDQLFFDEEGVFLTGSEILPRNAGVDTPIVTLEIESKGDVGQTEWQGLNTEDDAVILERGFSDLLCL